MFFFLCFVLLLDTHRRVKAPLNFSEHKFSCHGQEVRAVCQGGGEQAGRVQLTIISRELEKKNRK